MFTFSLFTKIHLLGFGVTEYTTFAKAGAHVLICKCSTASQCELLFAIFVLGGQVTKWEHLCRGLKSVWLEEARKEIGEFVWSNNGGNSSRCEGKRFAVGYHCVPVISWSSLAKQLLRSWEESIGAILGLGELVLGSRCSFPQRTN